MIDLRPIPGYSPYLAGDDGKIYRPIRHKHSPNYPIKEVARSVSDYGYLRLSWRGSYVGAHVLIAIVFHGPRPTPAHLVRHIDGNKLNNRPSNLAWGTHAENAADAVGHQTYRGTKNGRAYLNEQIVIAMRQAAAAGSPKEAVAERFGVPLRNVRSVLERKSWTHI
jgi:hypothetical protein